MHDGPECESRRRGAADRSRRAELAGATRHALQLEPQPSPASATRWPPTCHMLASLTGRQGRQRRQGRGEGGAASAPTSMPSRPDVTHSSHAHPGGGAARRRPAARAGTAGVGAHRVLIFAGGVLHRSPPVRLRVSPGLTLGSGRDLGALRPAHSAPFRDSIDPLRPLNTAPPSSRLRP